MSTLRSIFFLGSLLLAGICSAQQPELILPSANSNQLQAVTISRSEKYIASADLDGKIKIWENSSGRLIKTLARTNIYELAFTPDENKLIITSFSSPEAYNIKIGQSEVLGDQKYCEGLAVSPDGNWIAIGGEQDGSRTVSLWDAKTLQKKQTIKPLKSNLEVIFSPDSKLLILFGKTTPEVWSMQTNSLLFTLQGHS